MKINLTSVFKMMVTALLLSLLFLVYSCGARKAEKSRTAETLKVETKTDVVVAKTEDTNVKKTEKTTVDDKNETLTKETTYEPIDPSKPASITEPDGRKTDLNNSKKTTRETSQKNQVKKDNFIETAIKSTSEVLENIKTESKSNSKKTEELIKIDKEVWNVWNLVWLLIPAAAVYWVWKNKAKIVGWFNGIWWI